MGKEYRERVWQNKGLKGGRLLVMLALADHADADGEAYPGMPLLMDKTRLTDRQLRRVLNGLHADGLISIEERAIGRGKRPHYKLFPNEKADILSEEKRTFCPPLEEKADISDNKSGHFVHEKADIFGANQSHVRREPTTEPKAEKGESAPARGSHEFFDPRKFVNGKVPTGTGTTPAEVFYEIHTAKDSNQLLSRYALEVISEQVDDLARWRTVVSAWELSSFKATNIQGQLEWYRDGIPKHGPPATNGVHKNGALSEAEKGLLITRARNAQKEIRMIEQFGGVIDPALQKDIERAKGYGLI